MHDDISALEQKLLNAIAQVNDLNSLEQLRVEALGKKGEVSLLMRGLGSMSPEERQSFGPLLNGLKSQVASAIDERQTILGREALNERLATEHLDVSLPARHVAQGSLHPIGEVIDEVTAIFGSMGFAVAEGPHIEDDFHNFTALNIPADHPARQEHDTFYFAADDEGQRPVLRTHTSPVQIRTMVAEEPPIRIIAPGRTFRCDSDQTHTPMFHQVEGLVIDGDTHMGQLKWTLEAFAKAFFEVDEVKMRFRASHFPFTEPSMEVDIGCRFEKDRIVIGEGDDWLEILGCGMVHPNVLRACGLDPEQHQGFAFGMGIDRLAMLKYGIPDLRAFFEGDVRWLAHYGFGAFHHPDLAGGLAP
ncbi:MAG: phenylalanine--tRNA ligase subunit alpha [SAR116 cluster bacterium]|nr:MAG: phenylalanine--tRNA ligase subunit alpha [SAR116 cluster bacterium]HBQ22672.1 phenylalanine--tRNA ligase subunit alpha [Alphaproteobacteria bacterium]|tara:strand:- start:4367 stop:5446 length:1080 start_codon:yes stop_codon:yes gene_type:complete